MPFTSQLLPQQYEDLYKKRDRNQTSTEKNNIRADPDIRHSGTKANRGQQGTIHLSRCSSQQMESRVQQSQHETQTKVSCKAHFKANNLTFSWVRIPGVYNHRSGGALWICNSWCPLERKSKCFPQESCAIDWKANDQLRALIEAKALEAAKRDS